MLSHISWLRIVAMTWLWCCVLQPAPATAQQAASVVLSPVISQKVQTGHTFVGNVNPIRTSIIGSAVDGRVDAFGVNEGDEIRQGQQLAQLRTRTIEIELTRAKANLAAKRQEHLELKTGLRPEERRQVLARMESAQAMADFVDARRRRMDKLVDSGSVSEDELQEVVANAQQAAKLLAEATEAYELAKAGPRAERVARAEAEVQVAQAEVDRLADIVEKYTIRAPFDGYVVAEHTEVGQWIKQGDPVAHIVALDEVEVRVHVPERYVPALRIGMPARVEVSALPGQAFQGRLAAIVPQADIRSRSFPVNIRLANPAGPTGRMLKAGMFTRVTLAVGSEQPAMLVSKDALVLGDRYPRIFVARTTGDATQVKSVPIELGVAFKGLIEVRGELKPGDLVVVEGNERLRDGQAVSAVSKGTAN